MTEHRRTGDATGWSETVAGALRKTHRHGARDVESLEHLCVLGLHEQRPDSVLQSAGHGGVEGIVSVISETLARARDATVLL
jgi:hypothetical protein